MKLAKELLSLLLTLASVWVARGFSCYNNNGYYYRGGGGPRREFLRQRQKQIDNAFQNLKDEMKESRFPQEDAIRKQREWLNKAFDFAQDLNADFAASPDAERRNREDLDQVRSWINRMYGDEDGVDAMYTEDGSVNTTATAKVRRWDPRSQTRETADAYQIALDLPGVDESDIDIRLDEKLKKLTIQGARRYFGGILEEGTEDSDRSSRTMSFSKSFYLLEDVDESAIKAELRNGVLLVSAGKVKKDEDTSSSRRIPIT